MKLPQLKIGKLTAQLPIVQGGMAVRISTAPLAAAVANAGGIGIIGGTGMSVSELIDQVKKAKLLAPAGIVGVNLMFVSREFFELVEASIKAGADIIFTGAGFSRDVFKYGKKFDIPIVSIVSSAKTALLALRCGADAVVVEGKEAGGHLGTDRPMMEILKEVVDAIKKKIPVLGAGGIINGKDIAEVLKTGADGVQMATRFVLSEECDISDKFKQHYLNSKKEDMAIFQSPVGLPGRAIKTPFLKDVLNKTVSPFKCEHLCMKKCKRFFCIMKALIDAKEGRIDNGVVFAGENFYKIKEILPVKTIMKNLVSEAEANL